MGLGTAVGSLLISLGLTFIIFTSFTSDLMHQEQQALNMAMTNVEKNVGQSKSSVDGN